MAAPAPALGPPTRAFAIPDIGVEIVAPDAWRLTSLADGYRLAPPGEDGVVVRRFAPEDAVAAPGDEVYVDLELGGNATARCAAPAELIEVCRTMTRLVRGGRR